MHVVPGSVAAVTVSGDVCVGKFVVVVSRSAFRDVEVGVSGVPAWCGFSSVSHWS